MNNEDNAERKISAGDVPSKFKELFKNRAPELSATERAKVMEAEEIEDAKRLEEQKIELARRREERERLRRESTSALKYFGTLELYDWDSYGLQCWELKSVTGTVGAALERYVQTRILPNNDPNKFGLLNWPTFDRPTFDCPNLSAPIEGSAIVRLGASDIKPHCELWFQDGQLHREDGPALEWEDGSKYWFRNGKHHRADGPAEISSDGKEIWRINDELIDDTKISEIIKNHELNPDWREWTDTEKFIFRLAV